MPADVAVSGVALSVLAIGLDALLNGASTFLANLGDAPGIGESMLELFAEAMFLTFVVWRLNHERNMTRRSRRQISDG
ncbi:MAG: hypothetical protein O3B95_00010 [Chloroflexi bacterium]|nr:hypothetical protein [Chloroflexota bacterium]